jgi:hypothetical protein
MYEWESNEVYQLNVGCSTINSKSVTGIRQTMMYSTTILDHQTLSLFQIIDKTRVFGQHKIVN